jgi:hypothetical protein
MQIAPTLFFELQKNTNSPKGITKHSEQHMIILTYNSSVESVFSSISKMAMIVPKKAVIVSNGNLKQVF